MQLLRAARAACTNLTFWVTSIGSSLLLGPIFFYCYVQLGKKSGLIEDKKIILGYSGETSCCKCNAHPFSSH